MKLTTIWTLPAMSFRERVRRTVDLFAMKFAYRLPKRVKMWAYIHVGVAAIRNDEAVPDVKFIDLLERASK